MVHRTLTLDVYCFVDTLYTEDDKYLPVVPETLPWDDVEDYRIRLSDLRRSFGVVDDNAVARALCQQFMGPDAKKWLLEFARKNGCKISESIMLLD